MFLITLISTSLFFWSCGSDDNTSEPTNLAPECAIITPANYSGFYSGDTITVKVNAEDPDGDIKEVRFFLDSVGVASVQVFPYDTKILTNSLLAGSHNILIAVEDDQGAESQINVPFGIKPFSPSNLQLTQNNVYTFTLNWSDNSSDEQGFKIERKIDEGDFIDIITTTANTFIDSTISKKGFSSVSYKVKAFADIYDSDYSTSSYLIDFPAPYNLTYTKIDISTIRLNWLESSTEEDGFKIDKKVGNTDWIIGYGTVGENITNWSDSDAQINEFLMYRVYGYKGINSSDSILTSAIDNSLLPPSNINFTQNDLFSINLSWVDNTLGEEKFLIERKLSSETAFTTIAEIPGSDTHSKTWVDSGLLINNIYDYRIKTVAGDFESLPTSKTFDNEFKSPTNLTLTQKNIYTITLNWNDNSIGEEGYRIERKVDNGAWITDYQLLNANETTWTDNNLISKVKYSYRICAYYGEFSSNYSEEVAITPIYDIIITEIMFNPSSDENQDEFIEIFNNTNNQIDLTGWSIADNSENDLLIKYFGFDNLTLKPQHYCVIMDSSYYLNSTAYEEIIPDSVLRVMINDGSIGQYGLSNTYNETVKLFNPLSELVDSCTYNYLQSEGFSYERYSIVSDDWTKSIVFKGTPGFKNSISNKKSE